MRHLMLILVLLLMISADAFGQSGKTGSSTQSNSTSPGPSSNAPGPGPSANNSPSGGGQGTLAIEAEILAYKGLQSDGEAIACDLAGFLMSPQSAGLTPNGPVEQRVASPCASGSPGQRVTRGQLNGGSVSSAKLTGGKLEGNTASGANLTDAVVTGATLTNVMVSGPSIQGVVVLSSSGTTLANFQSWRMDMSLMRQLQIRAADFKCPSVDREKTLGIAGLDAATEAVALVQSVLGLFASNESAAGLIGTIQDQALMNVVSRQLRALNVPVLMPDTYSPYTLGGVDFKNSPFLSSLGLLMRCRVCLQAILRDPAFQVDKAALDALTAKRKSDADKLQTDQDQIAKGQLPNDQLQAKQTEVSQLKQQIQQADQEIGSRTAVQAQANDVSGLVATIDMFLASLTGGAPPPSAGNQQSNYQNTQPPASNQLNINAPSPAASAPPPIASVLAADGLAQELGVGVDGAVPAESIWQHVLILKALESGGSQITHSNIFGSKVFFSGGAVASYSLFTLNGHLSCSGNVYDYGGYLRAEDFARAFRSPDIDPSKQLIFVRGGCSVPDAALAR
jgi:hypothetical protein